MTPEQLTVELSQIPVPDVATMLTRYVREACALDPVSAASTLMAAISIALPADEDEDPPRLIKAADFMAEIGDPPLALVPDFLPAKKLICLSGLPKQGKSLIGLEFLHSISTGRRLMGRFPVDKPGPAAYFGLEDGGHEIKSRLIQRGIIDVDNFYVCWQSFDMARETGLETFKRLIAEMPEPPSLVIIDTAREAFQLRDWNDASIVAPAISPLRKWAHHNCTIILITHNNKDKFASGVNKISGSGALVSSCDSFMILDNQKLLENGDLRWDWEMAGRGLKTTKYALQMDTNNLHVRVLDAEEVEYAKHEDRNNERKEWRKKIAQVLHDSDSHTLTVKAISLRTDCLYKFAYDVVREMIADKEIEKTGDTIKEEDGPGRPSPLYRLTEKGINYFFLVTGLLRGPKEIIIETDTEYF